MIRFIDIESGNVFNGSKPYVFWMDKEQSVNIIYVKKICVLTDGPVTVSLPSNSVFRLLDMNRLNELVDVDINDFQYKNIHQLYTNSLTDDGVTYQSYRIHMIYIAAQSDSIGEVHENFTINNEEFEIAADFYPENESLRTNLANFGVEIPESIQTAIYDENVHEESKDNILLNRKYKELLLNYWNIVAGKGSYKSLIDSLNWFEYGDLVKLEEIWRHDEWGQTRLNREELNMIMSEEVRTTLSNFTKTTYIGIYAALQKFIKENGEVQYEKLDDFEVTLSPEQSEVLLRGVTNSNYEGLLGEIVPKLESKFFKWSVQEMSLKMYLLGSFYEAYFMPIHLDLMHSTIESIVFANTIKCLNTTHLDRIDHFYNLESFECNIHDGDTFMLHDVNVQAGDMLKRQWDDSDDSDDYRTPMSNTVEIYEEHFITFTALADNSSVGIIACGSNQDILEYSIDKKTWNDFVPNDSIPLNVGDRVYVRGKISGDVDYYDSGTHFTINGSVTVSGNIANLWNYENLSQPLFVRCGFGLFGHCIGLVSAKKLRFPNVALTDSCYDHMFSGCVGLITGPEILPSTELADGCYTNMFTLCSNLTEVPRLPATVLASQCYSYMFNGCTSLETAPELPATKLADYCYEGMFANCTSLKTAPALPATKLAVYCYGGMFANCTSLETAPELPATTSADWCYYGMFTYCISLKTIPNSLPASKLTPYCYNRMFAGCTSLETAPELPATISADYCYREMFSGCVGLTTPPSVLPTTSINDNACYKMFANCTSLKTAPALPAATVSRYGYANMFDGCSSLETVPSLSATTVSQGSCYNMFSGCVGLKSVPDILPADNLTSASECYKWMFFNCESLTKAPTLPATQLSYSCYEGMFGNCKSLVDVPNTLPADSLVGRCYEGMFGGCISLEIAPTLPAATLVSGCYTQMFINCEKLKNVTCLASSSINVSNSTTEWMLGVPSGQTAADLGCIFTKRPNIYWPTGNNGIPSGWTIEDVVIE